MKDKRLGFLLPLLFMLSSFFTSPQVYADEIVMPSAEVFLHGNLGQQKAGNTLVIQCDVFNTGSVAHRFPVSLEINAEGQSATLPFQYAALKPGEFGTMTFHYTLPKESILGVYRVKSSVWQVEGPRKGLGIKSDIQFFEVVLGEVTKSVSLEKVDLQGKPEPGAKMKLSVLVRNSGKASFTLPVSVYLMGADEAFDPLVQTVVLNAKESKNLNFEFKIPASGIVPNAVVRIIAWDRKNDKGKLVMPYADAEASLYDTARTSAEVVITSTLGNKTRGGVFSVPCKVKNNGSTRFDFPVKFTVLDASDQIVVGPKVKKIILLPGEEKSVIFRGAVSEQGSYKAVVSVWKEYQGLDVFLNKFYETVQNFDVVMPEQEAGAAEGNTGDNGGTEKILPPRVKILDIIFSQAGQKTPIKVEAWDPLGVVSCKLYYHQAGDPNVDFVEMNLFSGSSKQGLWITEVDLSSLTGKIELYAEAANTESLVARSKEYYVSKMAPSVPVPQSTGK